MKYIGKINDIIRPKVTLNGYPVVQVEIRNTVNEIPLCSVELIPETANSFRHPDQEATLTVSWDGGSQELFSGYVNGTRMSVINGSITTGVDIVHKARDLFETSCQVPGITPQSNVDAQIVLYGPMGKSAEAKMKKKGHDTTTPRFNILEPFSVAMADFIVEYLNNTRPNGLIVQSRAGDKTKCIEALKKIGKDSAEYIGSFSFPDPAIAAGVAKGTMNILKRGGATNDMWDMLSVILGQFDCNLVCHPDGRTLIVPDYRGVKSSSGNVIPSEIIQKFDRSSLITRSPKECVIVDTIAVSEFGNSSIASVCGQASVDHPGSRGSMMMTLPQWIKEAGVLLASEDGGDKRIQEVMNSQAMCLLLRESMKMKTIDLVCPLIPGAVPGTSATFSPSSKLHAFGEMASLDIFSKEIDGYCNSISHYLSRDNFCTVLRFQTALEVDIFKKNDSHPHFPSGKMLSW